jgi:hypothetical protein
MVILGLLHVENSWPFSCYPTFDGWTTDTLTELSAQTLDAGTVTREWNLSWDPELLAAYPGWGTLTIQAMDLRIATQPKIAAVVDLWLKQHPELRAKHIVVFVDTYQMRPLDASRVRIARRKNCEFAF